MNGEWTILLWSFVVVAFLVKAAPVRSIVSTVRQQPILVQVVAVLSLCLAIISGSTKTNSQNSASSSDRNSSFIIQRSALSSGMPPHWQYSDTDSDADGIPDDWEKWTHGNRQVADGTIDRDADGLTDLEEFQNQTDPRTADTDGDGFNDAFEVANGMNPVSAEDFTPTEPDADHNGRIDLWENPPYYYYGFTDADHDGFDDYYELEVLEPASDENFDVIVDVYTTRSAVLTWDNGINGIVVLPTTGQAIRLRLPFGVNSTLNLLPSPTGTEPPSGELWKSRMRFAFSPRSGQNLYGNALVSLNGMIAHKVVNQESAIEFFAPLSPAGGFQTLSLTSGGASGPNMDINAGKFEVSYIDKYHGIDDLVGAFTVTNHLGMGNAVYDWSSAFGSMNPDSGMESWLTVTRGPGYEEELTVVTTAALDSESRVAVTSIVERCSPRVFSASISTNNFSPQLFEEISIGVTVPGCEHFSSLSWLEIEVLRETTGGFQHVASVDMKPSTPSVDRYLDTSALGGQTLGYAWDGRAQVTLPLADHPDVFTQGRVPFNRAMPEIRDGDPVPPPFYTVAVRLWNEGKSEVLHSYSQTVFIPQVVAVYWQPEAITAFRTPISYHFADGDSTPVYPGYGGGGPELFQGLIGYARQFMPADVNVRFTVALMEEPGLRSYYVKRVVIKPDEVVRLDKSRKKLYILGETGVIPRNERVGLQIDCFAGSFMGNWKNGYDRFAARLSKDDILHYQEMFDIPNSSDTLLLAMGHNIAHEMGHALGLVHGSYMVDGPEYHNPEEDPDFMMNRTTKPFERLRDSPPTWKELNLNYLKFILPTH